VCAPRRYNCLHEKELHAQNTDEGSGWNNRPRILGSSRNHSNINTSLSRLVAVYDDAFEIANGRHVAPDDQSSSQVAVRSVI